ncbi:Suf-domain-containing protein [Sistotremastrum niveocremeum HHB9708]|uniref:mRNA 3'-end-processing protein RNA14 n=1 Tax=Sistotremastrum niveocremeum HHB9708 TaxID=1314777 RepID=A0A164RVH0_9AGAM|nr:Suf-domain-containing protein [Sistotremastrum niveocremeum HHB9708]
MTTASALFERWLPTSASVELYKYQIEYLRNIHHADYATTCTFYEAAVDAVGHDRNAGGSWRDYLKFIQDKSDRQFKNRSEPAADAAIRINQMRRLYLRAIRIPLSDCDIIWEEYLGFEKRTSMATFELMRKYHEPVHERAKANLQVLNKYLSAVTSTVKPMPGSLQLLLPSPAAAPNERQLLEQWIRYIRWEESNPLQLDMQTREDEKQFASRMQGVYWKAAVSMRFHEEVWFRWFRWLDGLDPAKRPTEENPMNVLVDGVQANPTSSLLNSALAEQYKKQHRYAEAIATLKSFIEALGKALDEEQRSGSGASTLTLDSTSALQVYRDSRSGIREDQSLRMKTQQLGNAWFCYLRLLQQSHDQSAFRQALKAATKTRHLDWRVYVYAALTEYRSKADKANYIRIFEEALKKYPTEVELILQYLKHLIDINDENNAHDLFERVIANPVLTPDKAQPIWEMWTAHVSNFGGLEESLRLEGRMSAIYGNDPEAAMQRFMKRQEYILDPVGIAAAVPSPNDSQQTFTSRVDSDALLPTSEASPSAKPAISNNEGQSCRISPLPILSSSEEDRHLRRHDHPSPSYPDQRPFKRHKKDPHPTDRYGSRSTQNGGLEHTKA